MQPIRIFSKSAILRLDCFGLSIGNKDGLIIMYYCLKYDTCKQQVALRCEIYYQIDLYRVKMCMIAKFFTI